MSHKILVVDDHKVFAESIASVLRNKYEVVEVSSVEKAIQIVTTFSPDLIVTDLQLPDQDGFYLIKSVKSKGLDIKILVLSSLTNQSTIHKLIQLGINGFLNKNVSSIDLLNAIQKILQGESFFQADIYNDYIKNFKLKTDKSNEITPREIDVLKLIIEEKTTSEIAEILNISNYTVEGYRKNLLNKTGATNVVGLIKYAMKINLI
ncbi:response regulator transcription factor [Flavobacterium sp. J27]|uniref:response regulator n=1 Tax=Flavobacterium sp. J27 TaxID=2060419 RepID=UPI001030A81D|nr:response regulator transcription factor [Flavobacterium sp. J27]